MTTLIQSGDSMQPSLANRPPSAFRRYLVVTAISTPVNLAVLAAMLRLTSWHPVICNLITATIITVPGFVACSRWVWCVADDQARRALSYWTSSIVNVAAATGALWVLEAEGASRLALTVTPLAVYTMLWFARFAILDRVVFRRHASPATGG